MRTVALLSAGVLALSAVSACGKEDKGGGDGGPFYAGKTMELIVPLAPGGGTDIAMRIFAKYLPKYIDGNPKMVTINQDNGGNSIIAANQYIHDGSDGGLNLLALGGSNHSAVLFGNAQVEYHPNEDLIPLAGTTSGGVMVARSDTGLKSGADLKDFQGQLFFGGRRPEGSYMKRTLGFKILGTKVKELLGYEGAANLDVAFEQGETNINGVSSSTFLQDNLDKVKSGEQVVLYTEGSLDSNGEIVRDPALPDYPSIAEVYESIHGQAPSGEDWEAYKVLAAADGGVDKGLYIDKDAPQAAVDALNAAMPKMLKDPEFIAEAKDLLGDYPVLSGEQMRELVDKNIINSDSQALDYIKGWARQTYGVDLAEG
jgi:hypothetical protein